MKQIVRAPAVISSASSSAASASAEARTPSCSSSSGGFQIAVRREGSGAVSLSTSLMSGRPVRPSASSTGLAIVALASRKRGLDAVEGGRAPEPAQHVGDVGAEHAAVNVGLVDDDEREVREQVRPGGVVGQDPDVQHVGVGDHEVARRRICGALLAWGVAVVDRGAGSACSVRTR